MRLRTTIVFILLLLGYTSVVSQPCLPDGITFTTQSQIDNFQTNYPGCTEIEGNVRVDGPGNITNLYGLSVLTRLHGSFEIDINNLSSLEGLNNVQYIGGNLIIEDMNSLSSLSGLENLDTIQGWFSLGGGEGGLPLLTSLYGLNNLKHIGVMFAINRTNIMDFSGLENLRSIGGRFIITENPVLENLSGLEYLDSLEGLLITYNNNLSDLSQLQNLSYNGGELNINNCRSISNLSGLDGLSFIGGELWISSNDSLTSLSGLDNLDSISGKLVISNNQVLSNLIGLGNISAGSISELWIGGNPLLATCNVESVCDYLASPNGIVSINGNDTGCDSPVEIASACGIELPCLPYGHYYFRTQEQVDEFQSDYPNCEHLKGIADIQGGDITNLNGLNVVTSAETLVIQSTSSLFNLIGLENLDSISEELIIASNEKLYDLSSFENLNYVEGLLLIKWNDSIESLDGLENINSELISNLIIAENPRLTTCEVQSICDYLEIPNSIANIENNAPGCNNEQEVEEACTVGIPEQEVEHQVLVYPNPSTFEVTISAEQEIIDEVRIYNKLGQKVIHEINSSNTIDVSWLPHGLYIVEVVMDRLRIRKKLIVQ